MVNSEAHEMKRGEMLNRLRERREKWDMAIIGGGATGVGCAVEAASRGYSVVLLERSDFGKGTSSRSTKLAHGGVRYLEQGNIPLVMEALKERGLMRRNAPHLVHDLAFVVPSYDWWEAPFYGVGLRLYDLLAGKYGFGRSRNLSREETLERLPTLRTDGLRGGVVYYDGQFDDTRLLIHMAETASEQGAVLLNYVRVHGLVCDGDGMIAGLEARDEETGEELRIEAKVAINATGAFCDTVRGMAGAVEPMIAPSQGVHLVFDGSFLGGESAIMVPHTRDGRVMFALPWHDHTLVGTTDTPIADATMEPVAFEQEIEFILSTASLYLRKAPNRADVLSVFAGIRPLVRAGDGGNTAALSRDHTVRIEQSGLVTIAGGKWTTWRRMAEDCVDQSAMIGGLEERPSVTKELKIHGFHESAEEFGELEVYGADAPAIQEMMRAQPLLSERLHAQLPYRAAEVVWGARFEMARTVEDVLARRTRALFLNARAALAMAPRTAELMADELGRDAAWAATQVERFREVASRYVV
jgi:glycerol-3-phosphate dehydrogenase